MVAAPQRRHRVLDAVEDIVDRQDGVAYVAKSVAARIDRRECTLLVDGMPELERFLTPG
jgi:hypothetical protein